MSCKPTVILANAVLKKYYVSFGVKSIFKNSLKTVDL